VLTGALWILLPLVALATVLSSLHYALGNYSVVRLQELSESGRVRRAVERILRDVPGHILATGALRSFCNIAITICVLILFDVHHAEAAVGPGGAAEIHTSIRYGALAAALAVAFITVYFFGTVLPLSIAEHAGEHIICALAGPLLAVHLLAGPLRALGMIDHGVKRLSGAHRVSETEQVQDEIISAVAEGAREGALGESERSMIEAVVSFPDRSVEEIMTPRTEIEGFELTDDLAFIQKFIQEHGHSRIPVYQGDLDHIVGILYAKDLLRYLGTDPGAFRLRPVLRRPVWVPETKPLTELLYELRARKVHMAIVLDEYGGTTGLVTFEDILEEIVGEIQDEYEPLSESLPDIEFTPDRRAAEVEARAYIHDVNEALEPLSVEIPEGEDYDTIGGFVLARLGHIPVAGETVETDGLLITVLQAEPTRILRLRIDITRPRHADDRPEPEPEERPAAADHPAEPPRARRPADPADDRRTAPRPA
jgi:putative hemolysin